MKENDIALRPIHYASVSGDSKNSYVWEGNIPEDIDRSLQIIY